MATEVEEDEWEYFYDETETESFYVSLDVSSSLATLSQTRQYKTKTQSKDTTTTSKAKAKPSRRQSSATGAEEEDDNEDNGELDNEEEDVEDETAIQQPQLEDPEKDEAEEEEEEEAEEERTANKIQILNLHSDNPIIAYKNRVFSCSWNTLIGTGIYLAASSDPYKPPKFPLPEITPTTAILPIIGSTSIVLRAKPVTLHVKPGSSNLTSSTNAPLASTSGQQQNGSTTQDKDADLTDWYSQLAKLDLMGPGASNDPLRRLQLPFLARFAKLKREKGENEGVTYLAKNPLRGVRVSEDGTISEDVVAGNIRGGSSRGRPRGRPRGRGRGGGRGRGRGRGTTASQTLEDDGDTPIAGSDVEMAGTEMMLGSGAVIGEMAPSTQIVDRDADGEPDEAME